MIITAREDGVCRRCQREFRAGEKIHYAKEQPIYCTKSDCQEPAQGEPALAAASYSVKRGEQSLTSHRGQHGGDQHAHAGRATAAVPAGRPDQHASQQPLLQQRAAAASDMAFCRSELPELLGAAEAACEPAPLAAAFREQQLASLLDRLIPLLQLTRELLPPARG